MEKEMNEGIEYKLLLLYDLIKIFWATMSLQCGA